MEDLAVIFGLFTSPLPPTHTHTPTHPHTQHTHMHAVWSYCAFSRCTYCREQTYSAIDGHNQW